MELHTRRVSPQPDNLPAPLTANPEIVLEWIAVLEISVEELVTSETVRLQIATGGELCRQHRIPSPHEFVVSLQAYVNKAAATCPLCSCVEEEDLFGKEKLWENKFLYFHSFDFSEAPDHFLKWSFPFPLLISQASMAHMAHPEFLIIWILIEYHKSHLFEKSPESRAFCLNVHCMQATI
jgi:hypothetical protein